MLFAQKIVLCEGQDDVFAVRPYLEKRLDIDLDGGSISIIRAGDVVQLAGCASMASKLGIPWCAVYDEDRLPDGTIKPATEGVRERLAKLQSPVDFQAQWTGDLEACLGKSSGKADPAWQAKNIELKGSLEVRRDHPDYFKAREAIGEWVMR